MLQQQPLGGSSSSGSGSGGGGIGIGMIGGNSTGNSGGAAAGSSSVTGLGGSLLLNTSFSSIASYSSPLRDPQPLGRPFISTATPASQLQQHPPFLSSGLSANVLTGGGGPTPLNRMSFASSPLATGGGGGHRMHSPQLLRTHGALLNNTVAASPLPSSHNVSFLVQTATDQLHHQQTSTHFTTSSSSTGTPQIAAAAAGAAAVAGAGAAATGATTTAAGGGNLSFFSSIAAAAAAEAQARAAAAATGYTAPSSGTPISHTSAGASPPLPLGSVGGLLPPSNRLSLEEVKKELAKHKLECPESMWKEPETEQVQGLYSFAIEAVFRLTLGDVRMEELAGGDVRSFLPSLESLHFLAQDGRLHAKAIGNLRFLRLCQRLNRVLGLPEFTRETFAAPTSQGVLRFASACCSFLRLREGLLRHFDPLVQQHGQLQQQLRRVKCDLQALQEELQRLREEQQLQQPVAQQHKQQEAELRTEIDRLKKTLEPGLVEEHKRKTQQDNRLQQEVETLALDLSTLKQERDDLLSQVIHSPKKMVARREELRQQQREQDKQLLQLENACAPQQHIRQVLERGNKKAKKALQFLSAHMDNVLQPQVATRSETRLREKHYKELKEQRRALQQTVQQLQQQRESLQQQLRELQEAVDREAQDQQQRLAQAQKHTQQQTECLLRKQEEIDVMRQGAEQQAILLKEQQERQQQLLQALEGETQKLLTAIQTYFAQVDFLRSQLPLDMMVSQHPASSAPARSTKSESTRDVDDEDQRHQQQQQATVVGAAAAAAAGTGARAESGASHVTSITTTTAAAAVLNEHEACAHTVDHNKTRPLIVLGGDASEDDLLFCSSNSTSSPVNQTAVAIDDSSSNSCTLALLSDSSTVVCAEPDIIMSATNHSHNNLSTTTHLPQQPDTVDHHVEKATAAAGPPERLPRALDGGEDDLEFANEMLAEECAGIENNASSLTPLDEEYAHASTAVVAALNASNNDQAATALHHHQAAEPAAVATAGQAVAA